MIKYNSNTISKWYNSNVEINQMYYNGNLVFIKRNGTPKPKATCYEVVNNISSIIEPRFVNVYSKKDNSWYILNNFGEYEKYGLFGNSLESAYYEGKLVIDDGKEYIYSGDSWNYIGELTKTVMADENSGVTCEDIVCGIDINGASVSQTNPSVNLRDSNVISCEIGSAATSIDDYGFDSSPIQSIKIADGITDIGHEAFQDARSLTSITIPSTVERIGFWAFARMTSCQYVRFMASDVFSVTGKYGYTAMFHDWCPSVVYVPAASVDAYRAKGLSWWIDGSATKPSSIDKWILPAEEDAYPLTYTEKETPPTEITALSYEELLDYECPYEGLVGKVVDPNDTETVLGNYVYHEDGGWT